MGGSPASGARRFSPIGWSVNYLVSGLDALLSAERIDSDTFDRALLGLTRVGRITAALWDPFRGAEGDVIKRRYNEILDDWLTKDFDEEVAWEGSQSPDVVERIVIAVGFAALIAAAVLAVVIALSL